MRSRRTLIGSCLLTASLLLTACGSGGGESGPVTMTFQSLSDQPAAIEATNKIVEAWNQQHPDARVEVVPAGWDGVYDKLITQFNSGSAPDIVHYEAAGIVPFAKDGYLADLTPHLSEEKRADIPKGVLDSVTADGKVIGYPTELQSYVVFANRTLLQQAGVEIPTGPTMSWDQLRQIAKATTKDGTYGLGWGLSSPTAAFVALAPGFGGQYFQGTGEATTAQIGQGEMALPELVSQMAFQDKSILPVTLTQSGAKALAPFYAGQVAMTVQGSFQAANIAKDAPAGLDWIVLPPLAGPAGPAQAANPQTLSVNVDSEHVEQAAEFIEFFTSTENLVALNEADALIPPTTSARKALAEKLGSQNGWDAILATGEHLTSAPYLFVDKYAQWKDTVATPAYQRFLAQQTDAAGLAKELSDGWQNITR
ncbi:ABC-type glycerol-3-phosphate transport system, substrate-binding protein [Saccharopolyspora antimicrobica]|uniref:ABC-type glycerol-3-phosphate transport system, substrate-binding protein n=1 Tax=Saccharopolyspora antimicrobica TaxID=455193 RepID=A0A1I4VNY5_9PSEU|nr:sugar ABC transporter substrate-binding protein [Saccharopolyspora antimicrobica]RKT87296.1 carbohydrate ABC transporter substrate-binding protein (CUT1 family) [Saccharopolyspora antimicrobica]SFN02676.1 ABC-type glycerol-3-phosphate transport system, substrate-binding protein [Saccharopolyspora antimicrobica]